MQQKNATFGGSHKCELEKEIKNRREVPQTQAETPNWKITNVAEFLIM